jgi:succinate-semialdehyde dehydrogenase / glutarate-semialdehyde dehydrogenase
MKTTGSLLPLETASEVTNAATGDVLGTVPTMSSADAVRAVEAAFAAWPNWRSGSIKKRRECAQEVEQLVQGEQQ